MLVGSQVRGDRVCLMPSGSCPCRRTGSDVAASPSTESQTFRETRAQDTSNPNRQPGVAQRVLAFSSGTRQIAQHGRNLRFCVQGDRLDSGGMGSDSRAAMCNTPLLSGERELREDHTKHSACGPAGVSSSYFDAKWDVIGHARTSEGVHTPLMGSAPARFR